MRNRYYGIDIWRSALLILGIFVHAAWISGPQWIRVFPILSQHFRMESFFLISGFLAAISLEAKSIREWQVARLITLLIPMFTAFLFLIPVAHALLETRGVMAVIPEGVRSSVAHDPAIHLWFLVELVEFTMMMPLIKWVLSRVYATGMPSLDRIGNPGHTARTAIIVCAFVATALAIAAARSKVFGESIGFFQEMQRSSNVWNQALYAPVALLRMSVDAPYYILFYVTGVAAYERKDLLEDLTKGVLLPVSAMVACVTVVISLYIKNGVSETDVLLYSRGTYVSKILFFTKVLFSFSASMLILRNAIRIKRLPLWAGKLVSSSYSIYLLHIPVILAILAGVGSIFNHRGALYISVSVATLVACYVVHELFIARFWIASLILNGRIARPTPPFKVVSSLPLAPK